MNETAIERVTTVLRVAVGPLLAPFGSPPTDAEWRDLAERVLRAADSAGPDRERLFAAFRAGWDSSAEGCNAEVGPSVPIDEYLHESFNEWLMLDEWLKREDGA